MLFCISLDADYRAALSAANQTDAVRTRSRRTCPIAHAINIVLNII